MKSRMWSWLLLPGLLLLSGCPDGGGGSALVGSTATIVYRADQITDTVAELFSVGSGVKLNPALALPNTVQAFALTRDKRAVIYIADQDTAGVFEIYRVELANPGTSTKLNPTGGFGISGSKDVLDFKLIPDGSGIVYLADQDTDGVNELYIVRFASPGTTTKLNDTLVANGNVLDFDITANSTIVVYRADQDIDTVNELYQKTIGSVIAPAKLHANYAAGRSVNSFKLLPSSAGVLYLANQTTLTVVELYESVFGGALGAPVNSALVAGGNVFDFAISPDSTSVVYRADKDTDTVTELYLVLLSSLTISSKLNGPMVANGNVDSHYLVTADSASVVYIADQNVDGQNELYRTIFGGANTRLLTGLLAAPKAVYDVATIPDSSGVVYIADQDTPGTREVYRVLFATAPTSTKLNPTFAAARQAQEIAVTPDSGSVVYRANETSATAIELYRSFFTTAGSSTKLNGTLVPGGNVDAFAIR
jgi:hypothetical protein